MNRSVYFILGGVIILLFAGYLYDQFVGSPTQLEEPVQQKSGPKNGLVKTNDSSGKLRTEINYLNGNKHGLSYMYHSDGKTVQLELPYENGKRQGTSKKYFKTGILYAETPYENDKLHGIRKIYYRTGKIKAEVPYGYGFPGIGLVEYFSDGKVKEMPEIQFSQEYSIIYPSTSIPCKNTRFYIGKLMDDMFFDELSEDLRLLPKTDNQFYFSLNTFTPSYLDLQDIICSCESSQGNNIILKHRINTSSLKKVN